MGNAGTGKRRDGEAHSRKEGVRGGGGGSALEQGSGRRRRKGSGALVLTSAHPTFGTGAFKKSIQYFEQMHPNLHPIFEQVHPKAASNF